MSAKMLSSLQNTSPQSRSPNHHVNTSWHRNCHRTSASHRRIHLRPLCCCKSPKMPTALTTSSLTQYFRPTSTASTKPTAAPPSSPSSHPTAATQTSHAARRLTTLFLRKKAVFQCMRRFRVMVSVTELPSSTTSSTVTATNSGTVPEVTQKSTLGASSTKTTTQSTVSGSATPTKASAGNIERKVSTSAAVMLGIVVAMLFFQAGI
jgi:hypothetical protein